MFENGSVYNIVLTSLQCCRMAAWPQIYIFFANIFLFIFSVCNQVLFHVKFYNLALTLPLKPSFNFLGYPYPPPPHFVYLAICGLENQLFKNFLKQVLDLSRFF